MYTPIENHVGEKEEEKISKGLGQHQAEQG